jgi:hypothetical protein
MLEEARRLKNEGRAIYVMAADYQHAKILREQFGDENNSVKFETPSSLQNFDWRELRLVNAHPNCVVLVDHFAIEVHFSRLLQMLHRYDLGDSPPPPNSV